MFRPNSDDDMRPDAADAAGSPSVRLQDAADQDADADIGYADMQDAESVDLGTNSDTGSSPRSLRFVPIAASPLLDTPTVSGEDDDYRSETSSETTRRHHHHRSPGSNCSSTDVNDGSGKPQTVNRPRKHVTSSYSNHRDLSLRLKRAVHNADEHVNFDESLIGADVVLCVKSHSSSSSSATHVEASSACVQPPESGVKQFHAHRFMLAASSEPFRAMLTGRMREAHQREVEIHGVEPHVVEKMLLYIYTGGMCCCVSRIAFSLAIGAAFRGGLIASRVFRCGTGPGECSWALDRSGDV